MAPNARRMALVSVDVVGRRAGAVRVDVIDVLGARPASASAARIAFAAPSALGNTMSVASADMPVPASSARIGGAARCARSSVSSTKMPAPSPSTRPRRLALNGRQVSSAITRMASHAFTRRR